MNTISKIKHKFSHGGTRGVIGSALRHTANRIDPNSTVNSETKQTSEFLRWVGYAVPGMLDAGNIKAMQYAISNMPLGYPILEIGSFCGLSTVILSYFLDKLSLSTSVFTCDKWEFETQQLGKPLGDSSSVTHDMYKAYVKSTFIEVMHTFAAKRLPHTIECTSDEFFSRWFENEHTVDVFDRPVLLGGKISFCYIDGNHSYEFAKRDFENTDKALVSGGFILFDDSADGSDWEVNQLTRKIAAGHQYKVVSNNPNYLFQKN
jgi:hypothetical protein